MGMIMRWKSEQEPMQRQAVGSSLVLYRREGGFAGGRVGELFYSKASRLSTSITSGWSAC